MLVVLESISCSGYREDILLKMDREPYNSGLINTNLFYRKEGAGDSHGGAA